MTTNPIKKIFEKQTDPQVHRAFARYSLGDFEKEPFTVKVSKKITIKTGFEYLNFLHQFLAQNLQEEAEVEGVIESVKDLTPQLKELNLDFEEKRRFGKSGTKFLLKKQTISPGTYQKIIEVFWEEYLLFNTNSETASLKVKKQTTPKIGSPTEKFVTLKLDPNLFPPFKKDYLFDIDKDFKEAILNHTYFVADIDLDEQLLETDPERARKEAKRIGKIKREITLDDQKFKEYEIEMNV